MKGRQGQRFYKLTSHRGAAGLAPENTLSAVRKGLATNADRIEIDVRQSKDGEVIVLHDRTLNRTTTGRGTLTHFNLSELKQLKVGKETSFPAERIPTLDEVLALVGGKAQLVIEVKAGSASYPGIEARIIDLILRHKATSWVILQSFDDRVLFRLHELAPALNYHKLLEFKLPYLPAYRDTRWRIGSLKRYHWVKEFSINHQFASRRIVREFHQLNKPLNVWTVNRPKRMQKLLKRGVDGIITDHPHLAN